MGAVNAVLSIVSFTGILWDLSGPMVILGVEIPRVMVFLVFIYVLVTTAVAFWIGRPLIRLNFLNEKLSATYRYALVRVREYGESIAFYRGEPVERGGLLAKFAAVIRNWWRLVFRTLKFSGFNLAVNQLAIIFPFLIQGGPRMFAGQVTLGDVMQTGNAFGQVHDSLSFFRESYDDFAAFRATTIRLNGLLDTTDRSAKLPTLDATEHGDRLDLNGLSVGTPAGGAARHRSVSERRTGGGAPGSRRVGSGKTTLLRTVAGLWPYADGTVARPSGIALFLSQQPYMPLGTLREALTYPDPPDGAAASGGDDAALRGVLERVQLGHLADRLDETADWTRILSPGGAATPRLRADPALGTGDRVPRRSDRSRRRRLENSLYRTLREALPESVIVSVGHRSTLDGFHDRVLELRGGGRWAITDACADRIRRLRTDLLLGTKDSECCTGSQFNCEMCVTADKVEVFAQPRHRGSTARVRRGTRGWTPTL